MGEENGSGLNFLWVGFKLYPSVMVIIKKSREDIQFCVDYGRVNQLTRLMVYPMPLISDSL